MANEVRTPPLQPTAVAVGKAAPKKDPIAWVDAALEWLWHQLTSMRVAMLLMILLALLCVAGSIFVQMPTGTDGDAATKQMFLDSVLPKYGGWTYLLDAVGLLNVFNSLIFKVLVTALVISLIACTVHRIPGVWRTATKPRIDVGPGFFEHAPQREQIVVHATGGEALETIQKVLKKRHYRVLTMDDGTVHLYADRYRFMAFASLAGHVSLILILAGAIIGASLGFRNQSFVVAEGTTIPTGTEPGVAMKLIDFTDTWYTTEENLPQDYASQVELYKDGTLVAAQTIRVNEPLTYDGATYYQSSFGQAVVLTVTDASGKVIYNQGLPLAGTTTDGSDRFAGSLSLPGTADEIDVFATTGTQDTVIRPGQVQVELFSGATGNPVDEKVIDQSKSATIGTYSVTFQRESQFTLLSINRDPGQFLVWLGALLLFGGFTLVFLLPQRRVWARIAPRGGATVLSVASLGRRDVALGTDFDDLITDIRAALQAPAQA